MKINWKVRIKNKMFWLAVIPLLVLLIAQVTGVFGQELDLSETGDKLLKLVETIFSILALLGVVNDPTTEGLSDSKLAMTYTTPKPSESE